MVVFLGATVDAWKRAGYHENPDHADFRHGSLLDTFASVHTMYSSSRFTLSQLNGALRSVALGLENRATLAEPVSSPNRSAYGTRAACRHLLRAVLHAVCSCILHPAQTPRPAPEQRTHSVLAMHIRLNPESSTTAGSCWRRRWRMPRSSRRGGCRCRASCRRSTTAARCIELPFVPQIGCPSRYQEVQWVHWLLCHAEACPTSSEPRLVMATPKSTARNTNAEWFVDSTGALPAGEAKPKLHARVAVRRRRDHLHGRCIAPGTPWQQFCASRFWEEFPIWLVLQHTVLPLTPMLGHA